jgi:hypothetical protein
VSAERGHEKVYIALHHGTGPIDAGTRLTWDIHSATVDVVYGDISTSRLLDEMERAAPPQGEENDRFLCAMVVLGRRDLTLDEQKRVDDAHLVRDALLASIADDGV